GPLELHPAEAHLAGDAQHLVEGGIDEDTDAGDARMEMAGNRPGLRRHDPAGAGSEDEPNGVRSRPHRSPGVPEARDAADFDEGGPFQAPLSCGAPRCLQRQRGRSALTSTENLPPGAATSALSPTFLPSRALP